MPEMSNDEVLEYLVQKVEETAIGFSVTLNVNGLVIVGEPIRSKLYYDHLSRLFDTYTEKSEKSEGGRRENIVTPKTNDPTEFKALDNYYKDWKEFMIKLRDKKDKNNGRPTHIHLQNVEIWEVFSTEPFRFKYWRGKISSIDGFSVDRVSEDNQPPGTT